MDFLTRLAWIAGIIIAITWVVRDPVGAGHFAKSLQHVAIAGANALGTLAQSL